MDRWGEVTGPRRSEVWDRREGLEGLTREEPIAVGGDRESVGPGRGGVVGRWARPDSVDRPASGEILQAPTQMSQVDAIHRCAHADDR